ncbi:MAG: (2Fe-2S) ferredoxin domain-containing protein [Magnetococcales bacterium]|nr:(2Fe-2S) ferredoxin domain-containing protein [Magnetococcales bacterium]
MDPTPSEKAFYDIHVFCCVNSRDPAHPRGDCARRGAVEWHAYLKGRAKTIPNLGQVRINQSGCLDRCELGPVMVIYPQGVWYHYRTAEDVDEILDRHVVAGERVERLLLKNDALHPPV